jgi:hypothetical protein
MASEMRGEVAIKTMGEIARLYDKLAENADKPKN